MYALYVCAHIHTHTHTHTRTSSLAYPCTQDKMAESREESFSALDNGAHIYFCGLKGMMPGIQDMLEAACTAKGINYDEWLKNLRKNNQWHVEVY